MRCLIINDNSESLKSLKELIVAQQPKIQVFTASNQQEIALALTTSTINLAFIKVALWDYRLFQHLLVMPVLVFLSSAKEKYRESFENEVLYGLREPFRTSNIKNLFYRLAVKTVAEKPDFFFIQQRGTYKKVLFDAIDLIECKNENQIMLYTTGGDFLIEGNFKRLLKYLPKNMFKRISEALAIPTKDEDWLLDDGFVFRGKLLPLVFLLKDVKPMLEAIA
jgi:DNA-binding LytR/AlgR family response regulator